MESHGMNGRNEKYTQNFARGTLGIEKNFATRAQIGWQN
jgi:hypothetical protein